MRPTTNRRMLSTYQRMLLPGDAKRPHVGSVTAVQSSSSYRECCIRPRARPLFCSARHLCRQDVVALARPRQHGSLSRVIDDGLRALKLRQVFVIVLERTVFARALSGVRDGPGCQHRCPATSSCCAPPCSCTTAGYALTATIQLLIAWQSCNACNACSTASPLACRWRNSFSSADTATRQPGAYIAGCFGGYRIRHLSESHVQVQL